MYLTRYLSSHSIYVGTLYVLHYYTVLRMSIACIHVRTYVYLYRLLKPTWINIWPFDMYVRRSRGDGSFQKVRRKHCNITVVQSVTLPLYSMSHYSCRECHITVVQYVTLQLYSMSHYSITESTFLEVVGYIQTPLLNWYWGRSPRCHVVRMLHGQWLVDVWIGNNQLSTMQHHLLP